jgi:hypothetical protein
LVLANGLGSKLTSLYISALPWDITNWNVLKQFERLEKLELCAMPHRKSLQSILEIKSLRSLKMTTYYNTLLRNEDYAAAFEQAKPGGLKTFQLIIYGAEHRLEAKGLTALVTSCPQLRRLVLRQHTIKQSFPLHEELVNQNFPNLVELSVICSSQDATEDKMAAIVKKCPKLGTLNLLMNEDSDDSDDEYDDAYDDNYVFENDCISFPGLAEGDMKCVNPRRVYVNKGYWRKDDRQWRQDTDTR